MVAVAVIKRPGRSKLYLFYRDRDRKQVLRCSGTDDPVLARKYADEIEAVLKGNAQEETLRALLVEAAQSQGSTLKLKETRVPVSSLWAVYLKQPKPREILETTLREKKNHVMAWVTWMAERHPEVVGIADVSERCAAEYVQSLVDMGRSGQTVNNRLSALHDVFKMIRIGVGLERNVWDAVPRQEARVTRKESLTVDQVKALYVAGRGLPSRAGKGFWAAAVALAFHTGLRLGDVCELERGEYDLDKGVLRIVENKKWKKAKELVHVIHADYREYLPVAGTGYVWPNAAAAYQSGNGWIQDEFKSLCREAGIKRMAKVGGKNVPVITFHSLRATYVSVARDSGATLDDVRAQVGHGSVSMTEHYNHSVESAKRVAAVMPGLG